MVSLVSAPRHTPQRLPSMPQQAHTARWHRTHVEKQSSAYRLRKYKKLLKEETLPTKKITQKENPWLLFGCLDNYYYLCINLKCFIINEERDIMTDKIEDITKAVVYEIVSAMGDDGLEALLTADDLLASMAVPVTQFDFTYVDKRKLNKLMLAVFEFLKRSKLSINSYTKVGLYAKFEKLWVTSLTKEQKQGIIADYRIVDGFDNDGYAIFNAQNYHSWKSIFDKGQTPRLEYKRPQFGKGSKAIELIDDRPFTIYKAEEINGYWCVPLDISTDLWEKIIKGASNGIKRMLQCYRQLDVPNKRINLLEMEKMFGIKWEVFNACNTALGRRTQQMLNFAVVDENDDTKSRYWSTAMTRGRSENGQWVWEPRPELMEAAEKVLSEEKYPTVNTNESN